MTQQLLSECLWLFYFLSTSCSPVQIAGDAWSLWRISMFCFGLFIRSALWLEGAGCSQQRSQPVNQQEGSGIWSKNKFLASTLFILGSSSQLFINNYFFSSKLRICLYASVSIANVTHLCMTSHCKDFKMHTEAWKNCQWTLIWRFKDDISLFERATAMSEWNWNEIQDDQGFV